MVTEPVAEPVLGGAGLATRIGEHEAELVRDVLGVLVAEVPFYAGLPAELLGGDIRRSVEHALRLFRESVADHGRPPEAGLWQVADSAADRAEEGVPMESLVAAYFSGLRVCLEFVMRSVEPSEVGDLAETMRLITVFMGEVAGAVAVGYSRLAAAEAAENASARDELLRALLAGRPAHEAGERAGVALPARYAVLGVTVGVTADETRAGVDAGVSARRKIRRVRDEIRRHSAGEPLGRVTPGGVLALMPLEREAELRDRVVRLTRSLRLVAKAPVWVGYALAGPDEVHEIAPVCLRLSELAGGTGRPEGAYTLGDLALEYQLTSSSAALAVAAELLRPLQRSPDLAETLTRFVRLGADRRRTAAELHVHVNTVDNRLRRVHALIGVDPCDPVGFARVLAAEQARAWLAR